MARRGVVILLAMTMLVQGWAALAADRSGDTVSVTKQPDGSVLLEFDSELLGRRATALAWPPDVPGVGHRRLPVAYLLHDRVAAESARPAVDALDLAAQASSSGFLIVAPDMGDTAWCTTCAWVDGRGIGVAAESHLWQELAPAVEQHLRGDPEPGRTAIIGVGMGATGALVQAFRHPDRVNAVAAIDPHLDVLGATGATALTDLGSQGHGPVTSDEAGIRNLNPNDLAVNALAMDLELQIVSGHDIADNVATSAAWTGRGVAHTFVVADGTPADRYRMHLADRLTTRLRERAEQPPVFSYKSVDKDFSIWGWDVEVVRPNSEFLHVLGARADGSDLILAGTGSVSLTTPPTLMPNTRYTVTTTPDGRALPPAPPLVGEVEADADGRVTTTVDLGAVRDLDQTEALANTGVFSFPATRVRIEPVAAPAPAPSSPPRTELFRTTLPAPMDKWNVTIARSPTVVDFLGRRIEAHEQAYDLVFDSPALGRRVTTWVWLPNSYLSDSEPDPVAYFLHGTGYGRGHADVSEIRRNLDRQKYVVVVPDAGSTLWCRSCWWIDPLHDTYAEAYYAFKTAFFDNQQQIRDDKPAVAAETHLYDEVIPLVEALLYVRTDRGGRGVWGGSMGASAAAHHAIRHPDRWIFTGIQSGLVDMGDDADPGQQAYSSYHAHQGYPPDSHAGPRYSNLSGLDMAPQAVGTGLEVLISVGDGCITDEPNCEPPPTTSTSFFTEAYVRQENDRTVPRLAELGLQHAYHTYKGTHFPVPIPITYETFYIDALNRAFATPAITPVRFSHKFLERRFSTWGYDFVVERANEEFLHVLGARPDGRDFQLAGTGAVDIATPPTLAAGRAYRVRVTRAGQQPEDRVIVADSRGRLNIKLVLGAERPVDQYPAAVAAGAFTFPQTRVEVLGD